jgi:hypothetical protein
MVHFNCHHRIAFMCFLGCTAGRAGWTPMPIDKNLHWTGLVFFIASLLLHIVWWKALVIAVFMSACWYFSFGQRVICGLGAVMLLSGLLTWSGLLPALDYWPLSALIIAR